MNRTRLLLSFTALLAASLLAPPLCVAQLKDAAPKAERVRFGKPVTGQFRVGAEITAARGAFRNVKVMVAVPLQCDEQEVSIASEDFSSDVESVIYRDLPGGLARQMVINIPYLADQASARAVVTFDVTTRPILPPEETETAKLKIPAKTPRELRRYIAASPYIESRNAKLKKLSREVMREADEKLSDWQKIELLYDHMLETIEYVEGPDKSALTTLRDGNADCYGRSAVFIAMCRAAGVPARAVWVNGHCFAEFYMQDETEKGQWFPAESAGTRAFGEMPLARVVLQKGDNFRVPERPRDKLRYATDFIVGLPAKKGAGKPKVDFIREQL